VDLANAIGDASLVSLEGMINGGSAALAAAASASSGSGPEFTGTDFAPSTPNPPRILCLGVNYADHAIEGGRAVPTWPESFVRGAGSVIGAYDDLVKPALSERFDYEAELAIVIGKGGRYIRAEDAYEAIFGYSAMNDGSAREWQRAATQWTPGKNFEGTMPIGPEVVTNDEVVARAVEYFSTFTTLRPGDVIATGTPGGVGFARTPPVWMLPGDTIEVTVEGIGTITNHVVAEEGAPTDWAWMPLAAKTSTL
jgi:2-keto-4-pentenoate hydratase/2-oxohepta-3-ene-1,7-dioic acid hydratase in catechol pathway